MHRPILLVPAIVVLAFGHRIARADSPAVEITTDFPGGNAKVTKLQDQEVHVEPDLRGDRPWFYWCFEATANVPGTVRFVTPDKVIGFPNGGIGLQGPAISRDGGRTWNWMGTDDVDGPVFSHRFAKAGETVRFAVTIPYLQSDLEAFLEKHAENPHLEVGELTKSRAGRSVELLRIGEPGPDVRPVLFTARHHAAETIASHVLEGVLAAAMSDTPVGRSFRERYVLYAVPFVDKDGVEEGDQGKNRKPHDHNRDYGEESIYPEVQAIKELDAKHEFVFAVDFHCPTLVMADHQVMYFVGAKQHPAYNFDNVREFSRNIKEVLPDSAPHGPLVWLRDEEKPSPKCSRYFAFREGVVMSATFEFPFAPAGRKTDPASCRQYGEAILGAWVATRFVSPEG